jgi:hypothetical protein
LSFTYLASPYSVVQKIDRGLAGRIRKRRFERVCRKAAEMMLKGEQVFCPIAHSHPIEVLGFNGVIKDGDFWLKQDYAILKNANKLAVYKMDGWDLSYGVQQEIKFAEEHGIPIEYIEDDMRGMSDTGPGRKKK